jgi:hypothetical protein
MRSVSVSGDLLSSRLPQLYTAAMAYRGVERRREVREQSDVAAPIILPGGQVVKCQVTVFSASGAHLSVASAFGLPDTVELRVAGRT